MYHSRLSLPKVARPILTGPQVRRGTKVEFGLISAVGRFNVPGGEITAVRVVGKVSLYNTYILGLLHTQYSEVVPALRF